MLTFITTKRLFFELSTLLIVLVTMTYQTTAKEHLKDSNTDSRIWNENRRDMELVTIGRIPIKVKTEKGRLITIELPILVEARKNNGNN